jgi:Skp family chaperone for outer membrane proteins
MKQLVSAVQADLQNDETNLGAEQRRIEALPKEQQAAQVGPFQQKVEAWQQKRQQRSQELQATQQHQLQKIATELDPILNQVYVEKNCGLMLDRNQFMAANRGMDVTDVVIQRLDAKMPTLAPFERESAAQQGAAAPAAPAAASTTHKKK